MPTEDPLSAIDEEIERLQQAHAVLTGIPFAEQTGKRRGHQSVTSAKRPRLPTKRPGAR